MCRLLGRVAPSRDYDVRVGFHCSRIAGDLHSANECAM